MDAAQSFKSLVKFCKYEYIDNETKENSIIFLIAVTLGMSRDSSVNLVTIYELEGQGCIPGRVRCSFLHGVQASSGPPNLSIGSWGISLGIKT
jgi:hypothetical protein